MIVLVVYIGHGTFFLSGGGFIFLLASQFFGEVLSINNLRNLSLRKKGVRLYRSTRLTPPSLLVVERRVAAVGKCSAHSWFLVSHSYFLLGSLLLDTTQQLAVSHILGVCCLRIKPSFLPKLTTSSSVHPVSVRADCSSSRDTNYFVVTDCERQKRQSKNQTVAIHQGIKQAK